MDRSSWTLSSAALLGLVLAACSREDARAAEAGAQILFVDVAAGAGLDVVQVSGDARRWYIPESNGTGAAWLDHDGDGDLDLFVGNGQGLRYIDDGARLEVERTASTRLYRNDGELRFADVTNATGARREDWVNALAVGDVENDGDPDLFLGNFGADALLRNEGGSFVDGTGAAGVASDLWSSGAAFGDPDRDGDLDLYVANYCLFDLEAPGDEAQFLAHLPLTALPMSVGLARRLAPLGLESLGDLASLPCASVERRYGPEGVALHRLARGEDSSVLVPRPEPWRRVVLAAFEPPAEGLDRLEPVLAASMEQLLAALRERGRGVTRVRVILRGIDGRSESREIAPASAEERAPLLVELLRLKLQSDPPSGPVSDLELEVVEDHALAVHQNALFGEVARDAARRAEALSRLKTLLGEQVVAHPRPRRAHCLEQRWAFEEGSGRGARSDGQDPPVRTDGVTLRLLPEPEVLVPVRAGGRTVAFRRGRRTLEVAAVQGPRRLTGGWWGGAYERDEYDVQTPGGGGLPGLPGSALTALAAAGEMGLSVQIDHRFGSLEGR